MNDALASSPGPWFLPSAAQEAASGSPDEGFSLVDLTYVPHLERMAASTAYWKGLQLRGNPRQAVGDKCFCYRANFRLFRAIFTHTPQDKKLRC